MNVSIYSIQKDICFKTFFGPSGPQNGIFPLKTEHRFFYNHYAFSIHSICEIVKRECCIGVLGMWVQGSPARKCCRWRSANRMITEHSTFFSDPVPDPNTIFYGQHCARFQTLQQVNKETRKVNFV